MRDGIAGLKRYIEGHLEVATKARAAFNERYEGNPLWALEGVNHLIKVEAMAEQAKDAARLIEIFEGRRNLDEDHADRIAYENAIGFKLNDPDAERRLLDYLENSIRENLVRRARYADNRSTSVTSNLVSDCRISAMATFIDDRLFNWA